MNQRKVTRGRQTTHPHAAEVKSRAMLCAAIAVLAAGLACAPVFAALYKWTDASGRVIYSDQPPPGDAKVETLKAPPPAAATA